MGRPRLYRPSLPAGDPSALTERDPIAERAQLTAEFLAAMASSVGAATCRQYEETVSQFLAAIGDTALHELTRTDIAAYFEERTRRAIAVTDARRWSPSTAAKHRSALRRFFAYLYDCGIVPSSDVANVPLERRPKSSRPAAHGASTLAGILAQLDHAADDPDPDVAAQRALDAAVLSFIAAWGVSVGKVLSIRITDFRLVEKELRVIIGRGSERTEEFPLVGAPLIAYHRWSQARSAALARIGPRDELFVDPATGQPIRRQRVIRSLRRYARAAGAPEATVRSITPTAIRFQFGRELLQAGADPREVQAALGLQHLSSLRPYSVADADTRLAVLRRTARRERPQAPPPRIDS